MNSTAGDHGLHISQQFNADLEEVKKNMLEMGGMVESQVQKALDALISGDSGLAADVVKDDDAIDAKEMAIDQECNLIIARRQPAASDLRLVLAIIKAIRDLERIADESSKIAKAAIKISEKGELPGGLPEFRALGQRVQKMLNTALDAFVRHDEQAALQVAQEDADADNEYATAMRTMITLMKEDPNDISKILNVLWALRALERIGDHAKNICEHVIYMVVGMDVRHEKLKKIEKQLSS